MRSIATNAEMFLTIVHGLTHCSGRYAACLLSLCPSLVRVEMKGGENAIRNQRLSGPSDRGSSGSDLLANFDELSGCRSPTRSTMSQTRDVSRDGTRIHIDHALQHPSVVRVSLVLEDEIASFEGRVRWMKELGQGSWDVGVEFLRVLEGHGALMQFLKRRGSREGWAYVPEEDL